MERSAADNGSKLPSILASYASIYLRLAKQHEKAISVPNITTKATAKTDFTDQLPVQLKGE